MRSRQAAFCAFAASVLLALSVSIAGCSPSTSTESELEDTEAVGAADDAEGGMSNEEESGTAEANRTWRPSESVISVDELAGQEGLYVLSPDGQWLKPVYSDTRQVCFSCALDDENVDSSGEQVDLYEGNFPETIDRAAGEQLVIVTASSNTAVRVGMSSLTGFYQGAYISGNLEDYEEIEGANVAGEDFDITDYGVTQHVIYGQRKEDYSDRTDTAYSFGYDLYMLTTEWSPQEVWLNAGWYEGSTWVNEDIYIGMPFYIVRGNDHTRCESIPTHNGYFIVDTESLEPGVYVTDIDGEAWPYYVFFELTS